MEITDILIYITSNLITEGPSVDNTRILLRNNAVSILSEDDVLTAIDLTFVYSKVDGIDTLVAE